ncbi:hypothetical protein, partial [Pseudomonas syringae]|uniref:hypothetical protein n=1 Tax=Pseudomonas syringae TaxID=317 RepID=UPI0034D956BC
ANGSSTITTNSQFPANIPNGDIIFVPRGRGVVNCASYMEEMNTGMMSTQTLGTNVNTKVRFDNTIFNNFPAGFITKT